MTFSACVYCLVRGFSIGGVEEISLGFFLAFIFGILTAFLYRYSVAINAYLYNESVANLDRAMERQSVFWIMAVFVAIIWTIVYFVFNA